MKVLGNSYVPLANPVLAQSVAVECEANSDNKVEMQTTGTEKETHYAVEENHQD